MAKQQSTPRPHPRPAEKMGRTPVIDRAGAKPMRPAPIHRNHQKRGQR